MTARGHIYGLTSSLKKISKNNMMKWKNSIFLQNVWDLLNKKTTTQL